MSVEKRVARGVALLDEQHPGWDQRIKLERLDIGCRKGCIVGQLFGSFDQDNVERELGLAYWLTPRYGFAASLRHLVHKRELRDWDELTQEWTRVIKARRWERAADQLEQEHRALLRAGRRELVH